MNAMPMIEACMTRQPQCEGHLELHWFEHESNKPSVAVDTTYDLWRVERPNNGIFLSLITIKEA